MAWRRSAGLLDGPPVVVQPVVSTVAAASDAPVTRKLRLFMLLWMMDDTVNTFLEEEWVQSGMGCHGLPPRVSTPDGKSLHNPS